MAVEKEIVQKGGAWFTYGEERFNGRERFRVRLNEDKELFAKLEKEVKLALGMITEEVKVVKEAKKSKKEK